MKKYYSHCNNIKLDYNKIYIASIAVGKGKEYLAYMNIIERKRGELKVM